MAGKTFEYFHHIWVCDWDRDVHDMSHVAALKYLSLVVRRLWMKWKPSKRCPCLPGLKFTWFLPLKLKLKFLALKLKLKFLALKFT